MRTDGQTDMTKLNKSLFAKFANAPKVREIANHYGLLCNLQSKEGNQQTNFLLLSVEKYS